MKILVLNSGSSSLKYKLFDMAAGETVLARGLADRIGLSGSRFLHRGRDNRELVLEIPLPGHREAVEAMLGALTHPQHGVIGDVSEISAVGHRVVHGGEYFNRPVAVDGQVLEVLEECGKLAPLHNPPNIMGIRVCGKLIPGALQVAVFDTAFHQSMPDYAYIYPLPYDLYKKHRVRKYGFHGTSHKYVSLRAAEIAGPGAGDLRMVTCHLGNGSSLCAVSGARSLETTMGLTPLAGLMMGTRSGDIDPAVVNFLVEKEGISPAGVMEILNKKSGALGVSGLSSDFRDIEEAAREGHQGARLALDMFVYSVCRGVCSMLPALGGLDVLVFTAGIGENSPEIRRRVCQGLEFLGIALDHSKNSSRGSEAEISLPGSRVRVLVIPTDEEKMIAGETREVLLMPEENLPCRPFNNYIDS